MEWQRSPERIDEHIFHIHHGEKAFPYSNIEVLGYAKLGLTCQTGGRGRPYTWSATLLFARLKDQSDFRWYEVAFWSWANNDHRDAPFALDGYEKDIDYALGPITHSLQVAYGPLPIDGENEEDFHERWIGMFAKAAKGELGSPSGMPIKAFPK